MQKESPCLYLVLPCYNEEEVLPLSLERLTGLYHSLIASKRISHESRLLLVNDGSSDRTWEIISQAHADNEFICGVNLAANVGHQNALMAGIEVAKEICDISITIDVDLQDDLSKIAEMVAKYKEGADIVYGVRNERTTDSWFKRTTALLFYKLMQRLGVKSVYNHADFRLMSRRAMNELCRYRERNLFLRGIVPLIGYKVDYVYENREERLAGETKYTLKKMLNLAVDGITSFSVKPVRLILGLGALFIFMALVMLVYVLVGLIQGKTVAGWASIMLSLWFIGGSIMIALGVVGEYIARIYLEVKDRPRFNIEDKLMR